MANPKTKVVKLRKFTLLPHLQNRLVQKDRAVTKCDLVDNLYRKPLGLCEVIIDDFKRPSYCRVGRRCTATINPITNNVITIRRVARKEIKRFNLKRKGKRNVYVKIRKSK